MPESRHRRHGKERPRRGRFQSLAAVLGCDADGAPQRAKLTGRYDEPRLPFPARMQWLAKVQKLIGACAASKESYPHKLAAVARALAYAGDVCRPSIDYIAAVAGCVPNTVKACTAWLEEHGALTWSNTTKRHKTGRMVRSSNLYNFILDFAGATATVVRTMRAIWRERPRQISKGNRCPGVIQEELYSDPYRAMRNLARVAHERTAYLNQLWDARHAT
jgi:hypothetical protein